MDPTPVTDEAALATNFGDTGRWASSRVPELEGLPVRGVSLSYQAWQSPVSWVLLRAASTQGDRASHGQLVSQTPERHYSLHLWGG